MICVCPINDRHPIAKTFTALHYTYRHFTSSHLNFTQLHFTTLSFSLTPIKFPTAPSHLNDGHLMVVLAVTTKGPSDWNQKCLVWTLQGQGVNRCLFRCVRKISKIDYYHRHVCLSVRPHGITRLQVDGFHEIWYLRFFFRKAVEKIQVSLSSDKNNAHFTRKPIYVHLWSYLT